MLALREHQATAEQLPIISGNRIGVEVIRGAAGSGKTSTALLRLESLTHMFLSSHKRRQIERPVRVLVLTFNRTLAGYVEHLASKQIAAWENVHLEIDTFAAWACQSLGSPTIIGEGSRKALLLQLGNDIPLPSEFLCKEIDYICGRFKSDDRQMYISSERTGRGNSPAVPRALRPRILKLIDDFYSEIEGQGQVDWNQLAEKMSKLDSKEYDIVIVDEAQDFSANQIRAVRQHLGQRFCLTLVLDTAQRLYPRGFTWAETGIDMQTAVSHRLQENHRNTKEIARFAAGIIDGLTLDDDGTMPSFQSASRPGRKPIVCTGIYSQQMDFAIGWIRKEVNLSSETVAFLKPKGGRWFKDLRSKLDLVGLEHVEITRDRSWPDGDENIALCTMHSAKGLEFDHVIILGLSSSNTQHGTEADDDDLQLLRRLLAMAVGRARKSVIIGYKIGEASSLVNYFKAGTFEQVSL